MKLELNDRAKLRELSEEYQDSNLAEKNNNYFEEKPYFKEHENTNQWAKRIAILGHLLSMAIGSCCGYLVGYALFSGFDVAIVGSITVGALLGVIFILSLTFLWELIKHKFLHSFFKTFYQFKRKYTNWKDYTKMAILFGGSLVLSGYGGFEVVSRWFGDAQTTQTTMVDVDSKVAHIENAITKKQATIDTLEVGQQIYVQQGKLRRIKIDNHIARVEKDITVLNTALLAGREKWEDHNTDANGATKASNEDIIALHNTDKIWYALLFALCAMIADLLTLYTIRYNERYKYKSHLEMVGLEWFLEQQTRRSQKMKVAYKRDANNNEPPKPTKKPVETTEETTKENKPQNNEPPQTGSPSSDPTHGKMFWSEGMAYMWFKKETDGSLVTKKASELKALRNKAQARAVKAVSEDAKKNNTQKGVYYGDLYNQLITFQDQDKKAV